MAIEKPAGRKASEAASNSENGALSDDISRIVRYLNAQHSDSNVRQRGLASEISSRRNDLLDRLVAGRGSADIAREIAELAKALPAEPPQSPKPPASPLGNPVFSERFHSFCHELDLLLQAFQDRLANGRPTRH